MILNFYDQCILNLNKERWKSTGYYFFAIRVPHNNTINNRRFTCLGMCISGANSVNLKGLL